MFGSLAIQAQRSCRAIPVTGPSCYLIEPSYPFLRILKCTSLAEIAYHTSGSEACFVICIHTVGAHKEAWDALHAGLPMKGLFRCDTTVEGSSTALLQGRSTPSQRNKRHRSLKHAFLRLVRH